jgi:hypothetical protein
MADCARLQGTGWPTPRPARESAGRTALVEPKQRTNERSKCSQMRPKTRPEPRMPAPTLWRGPAFGPVRMAVAAGFEPAEGCPSRAFEARSLGRSDTPPPERLSRRRGGATGFHDRARPSPGGCSAGVLGRGLHSLLAVCTGCNMCRPSETYVNVVFPHRKHEV